MNTKTRRAAWRAAGRELAEALAVQGPNPGTDLRRRLEVAVEAHERACAAIRAAGEHFPEGEIYPY